MAKMIDRIKAKLDTTVAVSVPGLGTIAAKIVAVEADETVALLPTDETLPKIVMHYTQFIIQVPRAQA